MAVHRGASPIPSAGSAPTRGCGSRALPGPRTPQTYVLPNGRLSFKVIQQTITRIDLRENIMDFNNQPVITRDDVRLDVHPMLIYRLKDPVRVAYEVHPAQPSAPCPCHR